MCACMCLYLYAVDGNLPHKKNLVGLREEAEVVELGPLTSGLKYVESTRLLLDTAHE
jgi:hypothetical protein